MTDVVCVIDAGTTSVRCGLLDTAGRVVGHGEVTSTVQHPEAGAAEQSPEEIWTATVTAVRAALAASPTARVQGLTLSAQRASVAALDSAGVPVSPFLLWMDVRGAQSLDELGRSVGSARFSAVSGAPFGAMPAVARVLWLRSQHPEVFARTARFVAVSDWITSQLTGTPTPLDMTCAAWTGLLDVGRSAWSQELVGALDLDSALLPELCWASEQVGELGADAAELLGLDAGLPVFPGAGDQQCSSAGAGALTPGTASLNLGTSATFVMPATAEDPVPLGMVRGGHVLPGLEDREGTMPSCGSLLRWLAGTLGFAHTSAGYAAMIDEAMAVPAGAEGVRFLPVFAGYGTPSWQPAAASIGGLDLRHGRGHLVRAGLEGVALQYRHVLDGLTAGLPRPREVTLVGGAARSSGFASVLASVSRLPVRLLDADPQEAALRGAASCAWSTLGRPADPSSPSGRLIGPEDADADVYADLYAGYLDAVAAA